MNITVTDQSGVTHTIAAVPGVSLMIALKQAGLSVKAECGGCCLCSTCQVYVADNWQGRLPTKSDDEDVTLSEGYETNASSRLACQIEVTDEMDGLAVIIAPTFP